MTSGRLCKMLATFACLAAPLLAGCGGDDTAGTEAVTGPIPVSSLEKCDRPHLPDRTLCGTTEVDLESEDPSLGQIEIAFAVLPSRQEQPGTRRGLLGIEGGPGYGSVGSTSLYQGLFGDILDERDLIVIDPRGTGRSEAIDCPDLQTGLTARNVGVAACAKQLGERFGSYRTQAIVDDFATVLDRLGYDRVDVYGDSYGTYAGQSFAFRHPERVDRLVLEGAYPVRGESPWFPSVWRAGIRFLDVTCQRSPDCEGDAVARLGRVLEKQRELELPPGPFLDWLSAAGNWPPASYRQINRAVSAYLDGNEGPWSKLTGQQPQETGRPAGYSVGLEQAVSCNDYPMFWDKTAAPAERYRQLLDAVEDPPADFAPFTAREIALAPTVMYLGCLSAPPPDRFYQPPVEADAPAPEIPVLVASGELDNVTSPAEGRMTAALFPNAEFFLNPNGGHVFGEYYPNSPVARKIRDFLR